MNTTRCLILIMMWVFFVSTARSAEINGVWTGTRGSDMLFVSFTFSADGNRFTGNMQDGSLFGGDSKVQDGTIEGDKVSFTISNDQFTAFCKGTIDGDIMTLTASAKGMGGAENTNTVVLRRVGISRIDFPVKWLSQEIAVISMRDPRIKMVTDGIPNAAAVKMADMNEISKPLQDVQRELQNMKEVVSVGILSPIPFSEEATINAGRGRRIISKTPPPKGQSLSGIPVINADVSRNGFNILGIPIIAGRSFTEKDAADKVNWLDRKMKGDKTAFAAIVNQAAAEILWPGENAVGKEFFDVVGGAREVVGVVQNYHQTPDIYDNNEFIPTIYNPLEASSASLMGLQFLVKLRPDAFQKNFQINTQKRLQAIAPSLEIIVQPLSEYVKGAK